MGVAARARLDLLDEARAAPAALLAMH